MFPGGLHDHKGIVLALTKPFFCRTITNDVKSFARTCIRCLFTTSEPRALRLFSPPLHGVKPKARLKSDYLDHRRSLATHYVLLLCNDHSVYYLLFSSSGAAKQNAAFAIINWCSAFGVLDGRVSRATTEFSKEKVPLRTKVLRTPHHFVFHTGRGATYPRSVWDVDFCAFHGSSIQRYSCGSIISQSFSGCAAHSEPFPVLSAQGHCIYTASTAFSPTRLLSAFMRSRDAQRFRIDDFCFAVSLKCLILTG